MSGGNRVEGDSYQFCATGSYDPDGYHEYKLRPIVVLSSEIPWSDVENLIEETNSGYDSGSGYGGSGYSSGYDSGSGY